MEGPLIGVFLAGGGAAAGLGAYGIYSALKFEENISATRKDLILARDFMLDILRTLGPDTTNHLKAVEDVKKLVDEGQILRLTDISEMCETFDSLETCFRRVTGQESKASVTCSTTSTVVGSAGIGAAFGLLMNH